jgi:hypothetical protein
MMLALITLAAATDAIASGSGAIECPSRKANEVVVCGSRSGQSAYRISKLPERYDAKRIRAETNVASGVHARAHVDSVTMPDGNRSNRLMVTLSTAF